MRIHGNTSHNTIPQVVFGVIRSQQSCRKYRSTLVSEFELWQLTDSNPLRFSSASTPRIFPSAFQVLQGYGKKWGWRETSKMMLAVGVPESWMVKPKPSSMPRWGQVTRQQVVRSRGGLKGVVSLLVGPRCGSIEESGWDGRWRGPAIARWFEKLTRRSGSNTLSGWWTLEKHFTMWSLVMKARSLWSSFAQPAIERKTSQPRKSQSRSTLWRSMFGLESAGWGPRRFASSMEYWKLASTATSWRALWFLSCERSYRTTDLCKTTIPSILRGQQSNLWRTTESTGGARLPRARTSTPLRTCGTRSSSTRRLEWSPGPRSS